MSARYCSLTRDQFDGEMRHIGFRSIDLPGVFEYVYERTIHNGPNPNRFVVRIYSSVDVGTNMTRECGADAIRVFLFDTALGRSVLDWKTLRTKSALQNTTARAREAWGYVLDEDHHCPNCGAMMVERTGRAGAFLGCTHYPLCKKTRQIKAAA